MNLNQLQHNTNFASNAAVSPILLTLLICLAVLLTENALADNSMIKKQAVDSKTRDLSLTVAAGEDLKQPFQAPMSVTNSRLLHVASASSKADLVKKFRSLADRQTDELNNIDDRIKKYLKESTDVTLSTQDLKGADRKFRVLSDSLTLLNQAHLERKERQDLYNRFALAIESQWTGQPLQAFLSGQCLDMSELELTSEKGSSKVGVFLVYLSVAIRDVVDRSEDVANFIEDYTNYSTVLAPKSPVEFISSRSYTSGAISYSAKTIEPGKVSDLVSKKLDELEKKSASNSKSTGKKRASADSTRDLQLKNFEPDFAGAPNKASGEQ